MAYRLVAIDIDGTLLDPYLKISDRNLEVIRSAVEQGVTITLSTGRMFAAALPLARRLQLDVPLITCNGAAIICAKSKKVFYQKALPGELISSVVEYARELQMEVSLYTVDDIYVEKAWHNAVIHQDIDNAQVKQGELGPLAGERTIVKALLSSKDLHADAEKLYKRFGREATFYFSLPWFVEIVALGVDKGDALRALAQQLSVNRDEIMAIGDNFNDLAMIQYAGLGVAMGNAPDELKDLADYVTRSVDDDGVAHVIDHFVLQGRAEQASKERTLIIERG